MLEIILRRLSGDSIPFGGVLIICTLNQTQLAPVKGKPFLVLSHISSCFQMVGLQHSVHACNYPEFQQWQENARMHPSV